MTLRLVALMSVVLLLSLGALGLLMNHYQDQVLEEVARTASEVGRATLSTFEFKALDGEVSLPQTAAGEMVVWSTTLATLESEIDDVTGQPGAIVRSPSDAPEHWTPDPAVREHIVELRRRIEEGESGPHEIIVECQGSDVREIDEQSCITTRQSLEGEGENRFFVRIDDIRAESDPAEGLVLKFPRFMHRQQLDGSSATEAARSVHPAGARPDEAAQEHGAMEDHDVARDAEVVVERLGYPGSGPLAQEKLDEIHLPIHVQEYDEIFASIRTRSLILFLGVFVVGTVLSAGLATRFTRPIRRLDSGLRRLSDGDLDVEVEAQGKDEIARLGHAFNDMTRKLRANRDRSRDLARREKLSALGRLAAGVAHDVRNPLHSIGLTLQHLQETGRPREEQPAAEFDRSVEIIRGEVRRLDGLVSNFLRFATTDRRDQAEVDLRELVRETARLVKKEAEWRRVEVKVQIDEATPAIRADSESIRSAILNLVLNSFEAMPDGGELSLELGTDETTVFLEVSDNGSGIAEEDRERVFEFAYTTRDGGNGLGLAMVHQYIVEEHGGRVALESRPGEGTRVRLILPGSEEAS